jgi:hypothetical protein
MIPLSSIGYLLPHGLKIWLPLLTPGLRIEPQMGARIMMDHG